MILPKLLIPETSLDTLWSNQERLATGYDLYRTLAGFLAGSDTELVPDCKSWMFNLLQDDIPEERSCSDANILPTYCIYESSRTITAPNLKTCNMVEPGQRLICPLYSESFEKQLGSVVDNAFYRSQQTQSKPCPSHPEMRSNSTLNSNFLKVGNALNTFAQQQAE
jgi:hypothetical protein